MRPTSVSAILKEGTLISAKIGSNNIWYQTIVYKSEKNVVYIPIITSYVQNLVMTDIGIALKYGNEYFEYIFEGVVSDIKLEPPAFLVVKITKADERINQRAFSRYDTHLPSYVTPLWDEKPNFAVVVNLSLMGMAFISKHRFDYGDDCSVSIYLPNNSTAHVTGRTIRRSEKTNLIEYSMNFIAVAEEDSNLLSSYLYTLDEEGQRMQSDFFGNIKKLL